MAQKTNRWIGKARRHVTLGQLDLAEGLCRKILKKKPDHPDALLELGKVLYFQKKFEDGGKQFQRVLEQHPNDCEARLLLYSCYKDGKNFDAMMDLVREFSGPASIPDEKLAAYLAYLEICDWPRASALQEEVLELARNDKISHFRLPNFLLTLNSVPGISPSLMHELHQMWGNNALAAVKGSPPFKPLSFKRHERLRIGYLSPDFNLHPVGKFIEAIIASHDRNRFEIYCYAYLLKSDARTDQIRRLSDHFIDITQLSFIDLARHIHADGIDILVDLGGHTALSRLQAMLFRPAPVQITYLGYPNTTGIPTVDFRITDRYAECDEGTRHVETPLYMPQSFLCLGGLPEMERAETTPAEKNGYVTFGSLNHIRKINPDVIRIWSEILHRIDNSRLIIKSPGCDNDIIRGNILAEFKRHHIHSDRIQFLGFSNSYKEHARIYNQIDIALDSFPYNGTTTTCETLWMGVPVITLVGKQHAQRTSYSILKNIGFDASIAYSEEEYIDRAVDLASRPEGLSLLRKCIPTLIKHSILCQPREFTGQLEGLYLDACRRKGIDIPGLNDMAMSATTTLTMNGNVSIVVPRRTLEEPVTYIITEQGDWYEDEIRFLRNLVRPGMRVLDLQAGYGCYALSMAKQTGDTGVVLALEADADKRTCIKESARLNGFTWLLADDTNNELLKEFLQNDVDIIIAEKLDSLDVPEQISPLIMFPAICDTGMDKSLTVRMREQGYAPFRLIPGLNMLVPLPEVFTPVSWSRQVFFCKPDRVEQLSSEGYLARHELESVALSDNPSFWKKAIEQRSYANELLPLWEGQIQTQQTSDEWEQVRNALAAYAMAHDSKYPAALRYSYLTAALSLLLNTSGLQSSIPRLCSVARIASELGNYNVAIQALQMVSEGIRETQAFIPNEPFLAVAMSYDHSDFDNHLAEWILAQSLAQIELLQHPTSYFNESTLDETATTLQKLGFPTELITQRLDTSQKRLREKDKGKFAFDAANPKRWSEQVLQYHEQWQQRPDDPVLIDHIKQLRLSFADYCLTVQNISELTFVLKKGAQEGVKTLMNGNIRYEPLSDEEQDIVDTVLQKSDLHDPNILIAGILFLLPHVMPQHHDIIKLPEEILDIYLDFMHLPPPLFSQVGEAEKYFQFMKRWVTYLDENITRSNHPAWKKIARHFTFRNNFIPLYMTSNNLKELYIKRAKIMGVFLEMEGNHLNYSFKCRPASRKRIKIGFLSNGYLSPTETTSTLPCYRFLDRSRFEIILLSMYKTGTALETYCQKFADDFVHLQGSLPECVEMIRNQDLDILYLGTNVSAVTHHTTLLALFRLARIQIASGCSAGTTGMPYYDYFLSGRYIEPEKAAQSHYSEKLVLMEGSHHCYDFSFKSDSAPTICINRMKMDIPENAIIYAAGACCYKIIPELEAAWLRIIASVPEAYLVLYPFNPNWTDSYAIRPFTTRIENNFEKHKLKDRLRLLNISGQENVRKVVQFADIYLDSFPFSGPTSLLDPLEKNVPPVAMHGNNFRSMASSGLLRDLDIPELIGNSVNDYVSIAIELGMNHQYLKSLKLKLQKKMGNNPPFLNAQAFGKRMGDVFEKIASNELMKKAERKRKS